MLKKFMQDISLKLMLIMFLMMRLIEFKPNPKGPKRSARILVIGPPGSGRSTLAKQLAQTYGLVYVSTTELISDQIAKKTEVGRVALNLLNRGELGKMIQKEKQLQNCLMRLLMDWLIIDQNKLIAIYKVMFLMDIQKVQYSSFVLKIQIQTPLQQLSQNYQMSLFFRGSKERKIIQMNLLKTLKRGIQLLQSLLFLQYQLQRWKELLRSMEQTYSRLIFKVSAINTPRNILESVRFQLENNS